MEDQVTVETCDRCGVRYVDSCECDEYVDDLQNATLKAFGYALDREDCLVWLEADATIEQAVGWINHGCGPGDMQGCWTHDPDEAFPAA